MTEKQLNEIERRKSVDDIPKLLECVHELRGILAQCLRQAGHAEECGLLEGRRCDCWVKEAAQAQCAPKLPRE
jgi:hypothetical protein